MEKVKLTQKQADAIVKNVNAGLENGNILYRYLRYEGYDEQFRGLTFGALADALYIGYEVEPEFKVGDWVVEKVSGKVGVVHSIDCGQGSFHVDLLEYAVPQYQLKGDYRHATPEEIAKEKQRRWWAEHGREV